MPEFSCIRCPRAACVGCLDRWCDGVMVQAYSTLSRIASFKLGEKDSDENSGTSDRLGSIDLCRKNRD